MNTFREGDALVVGMTLVPSLLSRNRNFSLFENRELARARHRAAMLRGLVLQIAGAQGTVEALRVSRGEDCELSYLVPGLKMRRRASLSALELACVSYLAERAGVPDMRSTPEERGAIDAALRRLAADLPLAKVDDLRAKDPDPDRDPDS